MILIPGFSVGFEVGAENSEIDCEVADISHFICMVWVVQLPKKVVDLFQVADKTFINPGIFILSSRLDYHDQNLNFLLSLFLTLSLVCKSLSLFSNPIMFL